MKQRKYWGRVIWLALLLALTAGLCTPAAFAQAPPPTPAATCTTDPDFYVPPPVPGEGLISTIVTNVQDILYTVSSDMFIGIVDDPGFVTVVTAALTLYVAIYGIMFTFGMVQITVFDFAIRMIKMGIIAALVSPGSWAFFSSTVVTFFNCGTDDIINWVTSIATGLPPLGIGSCSANPPFSVLDTAISQALSAKMAVTLIAIFTTPPYGPLIGLLLMMALGSFLKSLLNAMWVYMMSLVLKALLFGIAPIFLACLLFSRTRHLFDGWLNQVVNASLQPILLFTFYSFFAVLITVSIGDILSNPACYTEAAATFRGTPNNLYKWSFEQMDSSIGQYMPFHGTYTFYGPEGGGAKVFPVDIMTVLTLLILAELAGRFNNVVVQIAMDLSGTLTNLSGMQGAFSDIMGGGGGQKGPARGLNVPLDNMSGAGKGVLAGGGGSGGGGAQQGGTSGNITNQLAGMTNRRGGVT